MVQGIHPPPVPHQGDPAPLLLDVDVDVDVGADVGVDLNVDLNVDLYVDVGLCVDDMVLSA